MCALTYSHQSQQNGSKVPICYATRSGGTTIDKDGEGGNPFATALIQLSSASDVGIEDFPVRLCELTTTISNGHQTPEWIGAVPFVDWRILEPAIGRKGHRTALVLVVSDYSSLGLARLAGAAWDEHRVSAMLERNGFLVTRGVGSSRNEILDALEEFRKASCDSDMAIVYSTGHGREAEGKVYLVPGDYPLEDGFPASELDRNAIHVAKLADVCSARSLNCVFFAGCRTREIKW